MNQEKTLLEASLRGDIAAFERIVFQYQALVCSIALSATGRLETSEELAQETFLRAWKSLSQLKELDKFRSWLCAIARNCIQNYLRDQKRQAAVISGSSELIEAAPSDSESIPESLIRKEEEAMMQQALMQIPQDYRDVLVLFYRQQQSVEQVAAMLELTESNVRTRLHRGRQLLRDEVAGRIERTLERTAPGKNFTKAVMVAVGGLAGGTAATSQAATASTTATGTSTFLTGIGVKIAAAAAAVIIGAGAWVYYANQPDKTETVKPVVTDSFVQQNDTSGETTITETPVTVKPAEIRKEAIAAQVPAAPVAEKTQPPVQKTIAEPNDAYEFKPRGVLSGLITDAETGKSISGDEVLISIPGNGERIYQTKTDEHGFYTFETIEKKGNYRIAIFSWNYIGIGMNQANPPIVNLDNTQRTVEHFKLRKACRIELNMKNEKGWPAGYAKVHVSRLSDSRGWQVGANDWGENMADSNGYCLLGGLEPNDTYMLTITHGRYVEEKRSNGQTVSERRYNYAPFGMTLFLDKPGETEKVDVVLEKGQTVHGFVQYQDGEPAGDVSIEPVPDWWCINQSNPSIPVEPNGFFTLEHIVSGNYKLYVRFPSGDAWSGGHTFNAHLPPENSDILKVTIPCKSPKSFASISGKIKWISDKRPHYIEIRADSPVHGDYSTRIWNFDKDDFCIDRMEPGIYTVSVEGDKLEPVTLKDVAAPSDNLLIELAYAAKPKLYGLVMDSVTKKPLNNFQVRVRKLKSLRGPNYGQGDEWISFSKGDGTFELEAVGPGVYQVQAQAVGYSSVWSQEINTDHNTAVQIALIPGVAGIRGIVINEKGIPVKNVKVVPLSLAGGTHSSNKDTFLSDKGAVTTNEKGEFVLTGLSPGSETLKATHPDYTFTIVRDIQTTLGQCTDNVKVVLLAGGIIEGFVYDNEGNPQEGVVIYAAEDYSYFSITQGEKGRLGLAVSEPNGFYRISGLPRQVCYLIRQNEWDATGVVRRTGLAIPGRTMKMDFGGSVCLRGQVVLDGKSLANEKILLASDGNPHFGNFMAYASTDAEGKFVFRGLIADKLAVYCRKQDSNRSEWLKLVSINCEGKDIDLGSISKQFTSLQLTIHQPPQAWKISNIYLAKEKSVSESFIAKHPTTPDESYVVSPILGGVYKAHIYRDDDLVYQKSVEIPENQEQVDLTIDLPAGTAKLYGTLSEKQAYVLLWSEDKRIQKAIVREATGVYEVCNLPSGKYHMGLSMTTEERNSITFYLSDGQQLMMNPDENSFGKYDMGAICIQTVSGDGLMIEGAQVRLQADERVVEPYTQSGSDVIFMTQAGKYTLRITCEGYKDIQQTVTLDPLPAGQRVDPRKNKMTIFLESKK